jgi:hypothetical protein
MLIPWRNQTHPTSRNSTPETFNAIRISDQKVDAVRPPNAEARLLRL